MAELPLNVSTGMVFGRFIAAVIDKEDVNQEPDVIPAQGGITFTASVPYLPNPGATPDPLTILKTPIKAVLDNEGYLCTPHPLTGVAMYRGVRLIATDDPDLLVTGWTWNVVYKFDMVEGIRPQIQDHSLLVPSDAEVDLTTAVKVPASVGYGLPQAEAAATRASADATTAAEQAALAAESASRAELASGAADGGVALLLADPLTETGATLADALAPKANSADVTNALATKVSQSDLTNSLATKADKTYVDDELANKANAQSITDGLALKANTIDVTNAMATKASTADLTSGLAPKADKTYVDSGLAVKANSVDVTNAIATRATTTALTSGLSGKVAKGELFTNPRDFGAVGDGVTDDTDAIQAAVDSLEGTQSFGGGAVLFDHGKYLISRTILVSTPGTHLASAGGFSVNLTPSGNMVGPVVKFAIPNMLFRGPRVTNLRFYMHGSTADGIRFEGAYDNAMLENVYVDGLNGNSTGIAFVPSPGATSIVSQTISATNCWASGVRTGNVFTGHAWHLEDVQEAVFVSCKGFGGGEVSGTAWYLKNTRGIQFYGCSAAFASIGFTLDSSGRSINGVTIDAPTLESLTNTITTTGSNPIANITMRNPRSQVGETLPAGPILLNNVTQSMLETHSISVDIAASCTQVQIITDDNNKVTDAGSRSTIIQYQNFGKPYTVSTLAVESANTPYSRLAVTGRTGYWQQQWSASSSLDSGLIGRYWDGAAWRNYHVIDAGATRHRFYAHNGTSSIESLGVSASPATNKSAVWLLTNDGTSTRLQQVEVGAVDSGGTGFRALRVPN